MRHESWSAFLCGGIVTRFIVVEFTDYNRVLLLFILGQAESRLNHAKGRDAFSILMSIDDVFNSQLH